MNKFAYLGIPGSFSHAAAQASAPDGTKLFGLSTFRDIFAAIEKGTAQHGVIPIENSLAGSIYENYDLLDAHEVYVCAEYYLPISHCLLGKGVTNDYKKLTRVYSHQKALEQCSEFFTAHPWIEQCAYSDTAAAAKFVGEQQDDSIAAIASKKAGELYGLPILKAKLEDNPHNFTRFLVIGKIKEQASGANKCSIIVRLPHVPGSLRQVFDVLADSQCNVMKIESRPLVGKAFEYVFYLDFCYDTATQPIQDILAALLRLSPSGKLLGLYERQSFN